MLKRVHDNSIEIPYLRIGDSAFPAPFHSGLEYSSPARGTWNIVHTGMLIPEAHEIFVCAASCLRGVVLTAYEMCAEDRFSTVSVEEKNLIEGNMEDLIIDGVSHIIERLPKRPPCVLVYTSCVHHFCGCDLDMVYTRLREKHPDIDFTDCYMNPIMRKSGRIPDQIMRSRLYSLLKPKEKHSNSVAFIGNNFPEDTEGTIYKTLSDNGIKIYELTSCHTYEEYQEMARAAFYIADFPAAAVGGQDLSERLGGTFLYLPFSFSYDEIKENLRKLSSSLPVTLPDFDNEIKSCEDALRALSETIQDTPIAIDYTAFSRPLGLARLLLTHGMNVQRVYVDSFIGEEKDDFDFLQENFPDLLIFPTVSAAMRFASDHVQTNYLCVGQKASHFLSSPHFVNIVENGGLYGFEGIRKLCGLMTQAFHEEKDYRALISQKGLGCESCI